MEVDGKVPRQSERPPTRAEEENNQPKDDEHDIAQDSSDDQGYTPNHDNGLAAATAEDLAWANARQAWVNKGLVNPGNVAGADRPDLDEIQQSQSSNPRQGWAINPGSGENSQAQPEIKDWTKKFGSIGVADPPKPGIENGAGPVGPSNQPPGERGTPDSTRN